MSFTVVGMGKKGSFTNGVIDERASSLSFEQERKWLNLYALADCVVGVHGSNMLLPSGLAQNVVELLPEDRLGNITQDLLWPNASIAGNDVLYRIRFLVGSNSLADVAPLRVASTVFSQLASKALYTAQVTSSIPENGNTYDAFSANRVVQRVSETHRAYLALRDRYIEERSSTAVGRIGTWARQIAYCYRVLQQNSPIRLVGLVKERRRRRVWQSSYWNNEARHQ